MSKIHVMSENLANKISAGEVVEKCASVVKELVENAIDAGSSSIKVELGQGGLQSIIITDDGIGMDREDALLAFSRHATSKLLKEDDLFFIDTLGFRGEALPSIASVSEVEMETSTGNIGTHIIIKGGKVITDEPAQARKGTKIKVSNLFYNTPARLKYLKSEATELANCVGYIEKLALSYPNIQFDLSNDEHLIVKTSGSGNLLKTIHEIYGLQVSSKMIEVKGSNDDYDIFGYICKPEILKSNRNHMITIVNGRIVKNMDLNRAINDAYYTYKPDIKYPIVVLKIDTDPTLIDVNIHPTKQDIKLSKVEGLYQLILKIIKDALYNNLLIPNAVERLDGVKDSVLPQTMIKNDVVLEKANDSEVIKETNDQTAFDFGINNDEIREENIAINDEMKRLVLYPVGAALGTYIIAENDSGVYLIDQHAAQERVNYERYLKALKEHKTATIATLFPITIELTPSEAIIIEQHKDILTNMGIILEEFGLNTYVVKEHPTWLIPGYEEESIRKIIDLIIKNGTNFDPIKFNEHVAITLACKMSIKANMHISHEAMETLLNELVATDNPYNCPHGRPTIIKFSIYDLERMFKRVMN